MVSASSRPPTPRTPSGARGAPPFRRRRRSRRRGSRQRDLTEPLLGLEARSTTANWPPRRARPRERDVNRRPMIGAGSRTRRARGRTARPHVARQLSQPRPAPAPATTGTTGRCSPLRAPGPLRSPRRGRRRVPRRGGLRGRRVVVAVALVASVHEAADTLGPPSESVPSAACDREQPLSSSCPGSRARSSTEPVPSTGCSAVHPSGRRHPGRRSSGDGRRSGRPTRRPRRPSPPRARSSARRGRARSGRRPRRPRM